VLSENGCELPREYIVRGNYLCGSGYEVMNDLLDLPTPPEAVFAANDQMAIDAMMAAQQRGMRVPEDVAVVGFDDIPMGSYISPTLTTVQQPVYELGWHAAQKAFEMIRTGIDQPTIAAPHKLFLPTSLVIRHSCGC